MFAFNSHLATAISLRGFAPPKGSQACKDGPWTHPRRPPAEIHAISYHFLRALFHLIRSARGMPTQYELEIGVRVLVKARHAPAGRPRIEVTAGRSDHEALRAAAASQESSDLQKNASPPAAAPRPLRAQPTATLHSAVQVGSLRRRCDDAGPRDS